MALSLEQVAELGARHAQLEAEQRLDELMETLGPNPLYEYPTIGKQFSGWDNTLKFYKNFFVTFSPHVVDTVLLNQWVNNNSVTQEYDVTLEFAGQRETHRLLGVLLVEGDRLGGERVYASELAIQRMLGELFYELEDSPTAPAKS